MNNTSLKILIFILFATMLSTSSCKSYWIKRKQIKNVKEIEKKKLEREQAANEEYQEKVIRHASIQSRKTKKEMKKNFKKSQRHAGNQKRFFLWRWFSGNKKQKTTAPGSQ